MTTATQEASGARTLVGFRDKAKVTGIPTSGLFLLTGDTKVGKTTFAASFPGSYVLELEKKRGDRIKFGRIDDSIKDVLDEQGNVTTPALKIFGEVLNLAIEDESVKTIVIDSVDELAKWIQADIAKDAGVEFLGKVQKGIDNRALWGEYAQRVYGLVNYLKDSGKLIILIAHRRVAEVDSEGKITKPAGINVSGKGGDFIAQQAEMVGYMGVRVLGGKTQHYLTFKGESDRAIWRSGIDELRDKEIIIPESDPYGAFAALFGEKTPARPAATLKPAPSKATGKKR